MVQNNLNLDLLDQSEPKTKNIFIEYFLREHRQKTFVTLSRFWPLSGWGGWVNPLKKENS